MIFLPFFIKINFSSFFGNFRWRQQKIKNPISQERFVRLGWFFDTRFLSIKRRGWSYRFLISRFLLEILFKSQKLQFRVFFRPSPGLTLKLILSQMLTILKICKTVLFFLSIWNLCKKISLIKRAVFEISCF